MSAPISSKFVKQLKDVMESYKSPISRQERDAAIQLIKDHYYGCLDRIRRGQCVNCQKVEIDYDLSSPHINRGDHIYHKLVAHWTHPNTPHNEKNIKRVWGYICDDCKQLLNAELAELQQELTKQRQAQRKADLTDDLAIINGKKKTTPSRRFNIVRTYLSRDSNEIERLKQLPYHDFLQSYYWDTIRRYKMYRAGYKCELCHAGGTLAVHHKTYEHRGQEFLYLDDLIVLCKNCHERHHNITPEPDDF